MGEPELDETALRARAEVTDDGWQLIITKRTDLHDDKADVTITDPDNQTSQVTLTDGKQPGVLEAIHPVDKAGLYHLKSGDQEVLVMVGPTDAPEFGDMFATEQRNWRQSLSSATGGGVFWLEDHPDGVDIKRTETGGMQYGRDWIGLKHNDQYRVTGSKAYPLWPAWLAVIVSVGRGYAGVAAGGETKLTKQVLGGVQKIIIEPKTIFPLSWEYSKHL